MQELEKLVSLVIHLTNRNEC